MNKKPFIIAHRGYCSLFPENTLASFESALYKCDLVEFDIMLTKDHKIIVFHDRFLSRLTNIEDFDKHKDKKRIAAYDCLQNPKDRDDWWVIDFTLDELKQLKLRQPFEERPQLNELVFKIPTLEEAIEEILQIKKNRLKDNKCGFLAELKTKWEKKDDEQDPILLQKLTEILQKYGLDSEEKCQEKNFPFYVQAFNHRILDLYSKTPLDLPVIHLFDSVEKINEEFLKQKAVRNMVGIGITQEHAKPQIRQLCNDKNLMMFYWTLRDDHTKNIPFGFKTYRQVYLHLLKVGINGFITEYPEFCQQYICEFYREE